MTYDYYSQQGNWLADAFQSQDKTEELEEWYEKPGCSTLTLLRQWRWTPQMADVAQMPQLTFLLQLNFTLHSPYLSQDDTDFYLLDNPVRKEWLFKIPYVAASSWKGALRAALWHGGLTESDPQAIRLFGVAREDEEGQAGCLQFYPTFFKIKKPGLEVINPHDRETGIGRNPITLECVPAGTKGTFTLLYLPPAGTTAVQTATDLHQVTTGLFQLLTSFGLGAKTSSGYGKVSKGAGTITIHASLPDNLLAPPSKTVPTRQLPNYLAAPDRLLPELRAKDGALISEEAYRRTLEEQGLTYNKKRRQIYKKARKWWTQRQESDPPEEETKEPVPSYTSHPFSSLSKLIPLAEAMEKALTKERHP